MPIVDLMAISSSHFAKLKHFIQMQLPNGFPVKIGEFCIFFTVDKNVDYGKSLFFTRFYMFLSM